jgi:hypothetical protein
MPNGTCSSLPVDAYTQALTLAKREAQGKVVSLLANAAELCPVVARLMESPSGTLAKLRLDEFGNRDDVTDDTVQFLKVWPRKVVRKKVKSLPF